MGHIRLLIITIFFFGVLRDHTHALTILIDPGHGGDEDGATASLIQSKKSSKKDEATIALIKEKDLALAFSKALYLELQKKYRVFLTRSVDRTVGLAERAEIAEKTKADLFISIHINSGPENQAFGFETYYLDNHNDIAIKKIERTENILQSTDNVEVKQILIDLAVDQTVSTSRPLAESIHSELKIGIGKKYKIPSRGVRPALFYVLALSKRPGVLLEVGFISSKNELQRMLNPAFQKQYAQGVAKGIDNFLNRPKHKSGRSLKKL